MSTNTYPVNDTVTLTETYAPGGVATDPDTVTLTVRAPNGAESVYTYSGGGLTKVSTGVYQKNVVPTATGLWAYEWAGTGAAPGVRQAQFYVEDALTRIANGLAPNALTDIGQVKLWLGQSDTDSSQDDRLTFLVNAASTVIHEYCQREFVSVLGSGTRNFALKRDGLITFGKYDLQSASLVQLDTDGSVTASTVDPAAYQLAPVDSPHGVYGSLRFYSFSIGPILRQWAGGIPRQVSVTGLWGFPSVPADVEQACVLTVAKWFKRDQVAWTNEYAVPQAGPGDGLNLPFDARMLLQPYKRFV